MLTFLTSGESHGPQLTAMIDGLPAGLQPWRDTDRPDVILLGAAYDGFFVRTDRSNEDLFFRKTSSEPAMQLMASFHTEENSILK